MTVHKVVKKDNINICLIGSVGLVDGQDANEDVFLEESQPKMGGKRVAPS